MTAHTFSFFKFSDGNYLSIIIEARKVKSQNYNIFTGILHTYPIMYIAVDERNTILSRASIYKDQLYMYPVKLSKPENGGLLLADMLHTMNDQTVYPTWYNTLWANCTSTIAYHINQISPGRLPSFSWQFTLGCYAGELALEAALLNTKLPLDQARKKYYITKRSQEVGYVPNYSQLIRQ